MKIPAFIAVAVIVAELSVTGLAQSKPAETNDPPKPARVTVSGSALMAPLMTKLGQGFQKQSGPLLAISGGGNAVGIAGLLQGSVDLCASSRALKPPEKERFQKEGKVVTEIIAGYDALVICVHASCTLESISIDQLKGIWMTGEISDWKTLGAEKPDGAIKPARRETVSAEHAFFMACVSGEGAPRRPAGNATEFASDSGVLDAIAGNPQLIGYVRPCEPRIGTKILPVMARGGEKPVAATAATVANRTYPLSQPLYLYTTRPENPGVKQFISFLKSPEGRSIVSEEGLVPAAAGGKK